MAATATQASLNRPGGPKAHRGRRTLYAIVVFLACVFVLDSLVGDRGLLALVREHKEHARLEDQLQRIKAENARLRERVRRLQGDPATIEEIARRDLGLIKPGEKLFILRDVPQPGGAKRTR